MTRLAFLLALLFPAFACAQSGAGEWVRQNEVAARLVSASETAGNTGTIQLGLELELALGWHTYWRSPGEVGMPTTIDWTDSQGLKTAEIAWPVPVRLVSQGIESLGYNMPKLLLPITAQVEAGQPLALRAAVDMLACADLCIPFTFKLALDLPAGAEKPSAFAEDIASWQKRVPVLAQADRAEIAENQLRVFLSTTPPLQDPDILVEAEAGGLRFAAPQPLQNHNGNGQAYTLQLASKPGKDQTLTDKNYRLTVIDNSHKLDIALANVPAAQTLPAPPAPAQRLNIIHALLVALVGGLVLNLMPCVLPVLSLKILSIVSHAGAPPSHVRLSFLANALGIITSFLGLAAIAITLKSTGTSFGWGVQFQHPNFVVPMAVILTLFAASLWDFVHIPLPRFLSDAINDRLPQGTEHDRTLVGNFITGVFATLLATPCSAPFVGTAIGFALTGTATDIVLIALAMGIGLAMPFLLIATFPGVARHLPRPGRWMVWMKFILGGALLVTALWLASVLGPQVERQTAQMIAGLPLLLMFILWIRASFARPVLFVRGVGVLFVLALVAMGIARFTQPGPTQQPLHWMVFNESRIPALVAEGKTVFVDVTADWCMTCKVNKKLVLDAEPTYSRLQHKDIVLMVADWTARDDSIGAYLAKYGRYGIPFNIAYGPAAPQGVAMPELLTAARVEQALKEAGLNLDNHPTPNHTKEQAND